MRSSGTEKMSDGDFLSEDDDDGNDGALAKGNGKPMISTFNDLYSQITLNSHVGKTEKNGFRGVRPSSSLSSRDSDYVVLMLDQKQKESEEVAMLIDRLQDNGVTCLFFKNRTKRSSTNLVLENKDHVLLESDNGSRAAKPPVFDLENSLNNIDSSKDKVQRLPVPNGHDCDSKSSNDDANFKDGPEEKIPPKRNGFPNVDDMYQLLSLNAPTQLNMPDPQTLIVKRKRKRRRKYPYMSRKSTRKRKRRNELNSQAAESVENVSEEVTLQCLPSLEEKDAEEPLRNGSVEAENDATPNEVSPKDPYVFIPDEDSLELPPVKLFSPKIKNGLKLEVSAESETINEINQEPCNILKDHTLVAESGENEEHDTESQSNNTDEEWTPRKARKRSKPKTPTVKSKKRKKRSTLSSRKRKRCKVQKPTTDCVHEISLALDSTPTLTSNPNVLQETFNNFQDSDNNLNSTSREDTELNKIPSLKTNAKLECKLLPSPEPEPVNECGNMSPKESTVEEKSKKLPNEHSEIGSEKSMVVQAKANVDIKPLKHTDSHVELLLKSPAAETQLDKSNFQDEESSLSELNEIQAVINHIIESLPDEVNDHVTFKVPEIPKTDHKPTKPVIEVESNQRAEENSFTDAMQLRRCSSFYSQITGNVRNNLENFLDGKFVNETSNSKSSKRRRRARNGFLLHHGDNFPDDPEAPYKLHLATQITLKLQKRRAKYKPKEDKGKHLLSYLRLIPKRASRAGKNQSVEEKESESTAMKTSEIAEAVDNELPSVFSGEWVQKRHFICNICGHTEQDFWDMVHHKGEVHPGIVVTHVELADPPPEGFRVPPPQPEVSCVPQCPPCTKCEATFSSYPELYKHIFECAGNASWLDINKEAPPETPRKKKPRRKRGFNCFKRRMSNTPKKKGETSAQKRRYVEVFKCEFCPREFKTEGWLKNHITTHSLPISIPLSKLKPLPVRASLNYSRRSCVQNLIASGSFKT